MENSVGQAIEKIKLLEQDNEVKLKEKRELNNAILSVNRAIRDCLTHLEKLSKEYQSLTLSTDKLLHQLVVEKTRHNALVDQVNSCCKELEELRQTSNDGVSAVWIKRSKLLETIQGTADKCDIWALLIKPTYNEIDPCVKTVQNNDQLIRNDTKLKDATERRNKAIAERDYLLSEPEIGEEFIRHAVLLTKIVAKFPKRHPAEPDSTTDLFLKVGPTSLDSLSQVEILFNNFENRTPNVYC